MKVFFPYKTKILKVPNGQVINSQLFHKKWETIIL